MVIYLALLIPIFTTLGFYLFNKSEFKWWEVFIPIFGTLAVIVITKFAFDTSSQYFIEWRGSNVTEVYEEEPWNSWESRQETYACGTTTDSNGNTSTKYCTRTVWYQDDHPPKWYLKTDMGLSESVYEKDYEEIAKLFNNTRKVVKTRRNHSASSRATGSSGTKFAGTRVGKESYIYKYVWPRTDETRKGFVSKHRYINRVKASDLTVFNISIVTDEEADSLHLFKYPDGPSGRDGLDFPVILGERIPKSVHDEYRKLEGKFGMSDSLRFWMLIFHNKPAEIAFYQENYWVNGNKNEIVLCVSLDDQKNIQWSHAFSWGKPTGITEACKNEALKYQFNNEGLIEYSKWLNKNLQKFGKRDFTDEFSYVKLKPSKASIITIIILALMFSIGTNIWAIRNDISDNVSKPKGRRNYGNFHRKRY